MALSPINGSNTLARIKEISNNRQPSRTYEFDFDRKDFTGQMIDRVQALQQFVRKALATPRFRHYIYSAKYGSEVEDLLGEDVTLNFLNSEIPRLVTEALIYDDRIQNVVDFVVTKDSASDQVFASFSVIAADGYIVKIEEVSL